MFLFRRTFPRAHYVSLDDPTLAQEADEAFIGKDLQGAQVVFHRHGPVLPFGRHSDSRRFAQKSTAWRRIRDACPGANMSRNVEQGPDGLEPVIVQAVVGPVESKGS